MSTTIKITIRDTRSVSIEEEEETSGSFSTSAIIEISILKFSVGCSFGN